MADEKFSMIDFQLLRSAEELLKTQERQKRKARSRLPQALMRCKTARGVVDI
jgi:hypothetical protein